MDKTWKAVERRIAAAHGTTRTGPTGKLGPDAVTDWLAIQVKRRKTLPFNGYADQVASLYTGMDLVKNF